MITPFVMNFYFNDWTKANSFAGTYNIVSSLYSGLGFIAIIYTIRVQQKEIQNEITSVNDTNRISYLTSLLTYYSSEEEKYMSTDAQKTNEAKLKKENILLLIEKEIPHAK